MVLQRGATPRSALYQNADLVGDLQEDGPLPWYCAKPARRLRVYSAARVFNGLLVDGASQGSRTLTSDVEQPQATVKPQ